jgi:D-amino peptidase
MNVLILTDLEGASQVTRFEEVRKDGDGYMQAKECLTKEVNAVILGLKKFDPKIKIHIWDGHGAGGLNPKDLLPNVAYLPPLPLEMYSYFRFHNIEALLFVGQHAMSYTYNGNLCHTMDHINIEYYALNGEPIAEFGLRAAIAGEMNVPTIFLSGDEKACIEAQKTIPEIITVPVKQGTGWETAISYPIDLVCENLFEQAFISMESISRISPFQISHPFDFQIAYRSWKSTMGHLQKGAISTGLRSIEYHANTLEELSKKGIF